MTDDLELLAYGRARLEAVGFALVSESGTGSSTQTTEYERGDCRVLIGVDRGERFITMRALGGSGDYHVGLWESCLDQTEPALGVRNFVSDVETIATRVGEFESLIGRGEASLDECLRRAGTTVFQARREKGLIQRDG